MLPRCDHYRIAADGMARRCRRRARWRLLLARTWGVCRVCLPDVLALRAEPVAVEALT